MEHKSLVLTESSIKDLSYDWIFYEDKVIFLVYKVYHLPISLLIVAIPSLVHSFHGLEFDSNYGHEREFPKK